MSTTSLLLASGSPYRARQLRQLGLTFSTCSPSVDESALPGESASALALRLAENKAEAVSGPQTGTWVLAGDQSAECSGRLLGKPGNISAATEQLRWMQGKTCYFHSAFCLLTPTCRHSQVVVTEVRLRPLRDQEIARYLAAESVLDCAGSFKVEGLGIALFEYVRSDDPSALIGLPLIAVASALRQFGWPVP